VAGNAGLNRTELIREKLSRVWILTPAFAGKIAPGGATPQHSDHGIAFLIDLARHNWTFFPLEKDYTPRTDRRKARILISALQNDGTHRGAPRAAHVASY
jgi:hypothetical protein